jgi:hypothetical protein
MNTATIAHTWDALTDEARELLTQKHRNNWRLGAIADEIDTAYGGESIIRFCEEVNGRPSSIYEYMRVVRYYPCGLDYVEMLPLLTWTHYREAAKLPDAQLAMTVLFETNDKNVPMADFMRRIKLLLNKPTPPEPLIEGEMTVADAIEQLQAYDTSKWIKAIVREISE